MKQDELEILKLSGVYASLKQFISYTSSSIFCRFLRFWHMLCPKAHASVCACGSNIEFLSLDIIPTEI